MTLAVERGADAQALAQRSGVDPAGLRDQDGRVPLAVYMALMRAGQALCADPALALHFGEAFEIDQLSIVGLIGQAAQTLADAFAQLNRYSRLIADFDDGARGDPLVLKPDGDDLWIVDTRSQPSGFPELVESAFARMACHSRRSAPDLQIIKAAHFIHPAPAYRAEYDRIFRAPIVFGSSMNALLTDKVWMTMTSPRPSQYVFGILGDRAQTLLEHLQSARSTRGAVERLLMTRLHTGDSRMGWVASQMGLSRQTLLRRLKAEGATFESVLRDLRHRLALDYLRGGKVSVNEAAYLVGFSDPAAFSRAFKRWTGHSPGRRPTA